MLVKKGVSLLVGVVYKITNCLNGMSYVGQTTRPIEERFKGHVHGTLFVDKVIQEVGVEHLLAKFSKNARQFSNLGNAKSFGLLNLIRYTLTDTILTTEWTI